MGSTSLSTALRTLTLVLLITPGCVIRHGDFTVLSNKLVQTSEFDLSSTESVQHVRGEEISHIIVFIPTIAQPTLEGAIDDALRKGGGDVMTDAVIHYYNWYIPFIYGRVGWSVEGDVVKTRTR
jgi:hypothetical protein